MAEFRDYENGVADVLSFIFGPSASVERNVHLPGRLSGVSRQIDILVHGPLGDTPDATIVVECKRGSNAVDGGDLDKFVGTLEDVGADLGFYMTSTGASAGARTRASNARTGIRLEIITIDELRRWQPSGTFRTVHCIPTSHLLRVKRTLQDAGFRVVKDTSFSPAEGETLFATLRHYGARSPRIEDQQNHMNTVARLLRQCGIADPALVSHGTVIEGATRPKDGLRSPYEGSQPVSKWWLATRSRRTRSWTVSPKSWASRGSCSRSFQPPIGR